MFKKLSAYLGVAVASMVSLFAVPASAQTDYSSLTGAVDWGTVGAALLSVGVAVVGIIVVMKGIGFVVRAVRRA